MQERTIKIKSFVWREEYERGGKTRGRNRSAKLGETVELPDDAIEYGEEMGAFVTEEDEAKDTALAESVAEMGEDELVNWVSEATIPEIINVAQADPELASSLLAAENTATGNDPRGGLTEALAQIAGSGESTSEEIIEVDATPGAVQLAEDEDIDLSEVEGSGEDGRISKADVQKFIEEAE